ncbi:MAG: UDP-N-acetylmuramoyl-L-alanine--D-glutamate ligase [Syntrophales bacterium]
MDLRGKNIAVIGLAKTGLATAEFLLHRGARVVVTDERPVPPLGDNLQAARIAPHDPGILKGVELVIPSPGVPPTNPILLEAVRQGIPVWSEIELAARFLKPPMIAITGTNGKTTTTSLIGHILAGSGKKAFVGGNIGSPLIGYVDGPQEDDYAVVEVSSFQLQWIESFHPAVAILLNVTSDHLDYHGSFAAYRLAKEHIFINQCPDDLAILNADDPGTEDLRKRLAARTLLFSSTRVVSPGIYSDDCRLVFAPYPLERETYPLDMMKIPGRHNVENVMAALMAVRSCGCDPLAIITAVETFPGIAHRIEYVGEYRGLSFYDDSKGTNVDAVYRALDTFSKPVVLLMGGRDKEGDFRALIPVLKEKVKRLILFGEARDTICSIIGGIVETRLCSTLEAGIETAIAAALPGDVILLSPGCASFDEFRDYKARGQFFKDKVKAFTHD